MNKKQLFEDVIAHWKRMIEFAKKQNPEAQPYYLDMEMTICESWFASNCAFCIAFNSSLGNKCRECPLHKNGFGCNYLDSLWYRVDTAKTWKDWLFYAEDFLEVIKNLYKKEFHNGKTL